MSIRRRRRNKGKQQTGSARMVAATPRVRQGPVEIPDVSMSAARQSGTQSLDAAPGPDYNYVKRDMIWMVAVSAVLFVAMIFIAPLV